MTYFTSDTHFWHANIIRYSNRPFQNVTEMNRELIKRWNDRVGPLDIVYHLGDFLMGQKSLLAPTLAKLNGRKILIRGNHDRSKGVMLEAGFDVVVDKMSTEVDGTLVHMHHKPDYENHTEIHLVGHVHNEWKRQGNTINVGVDQWDFTPRSLAELLESNKTESTNAIHSQV